MKKIILYIVALWLTTSVWASPLDSLRQIINQTNNDSIRIASWLQISDYYMNYHPDSTFYYAQKALDLAQKYNYTELMALAYSYMGVAKDISNRYTESLKYYEKGMRLARDSNTIYGIKLNKAIVFLVNGIYDKSYTLLNEVYQYARRHNQKEQLSAVYAYLAQLFTQQKKYDSAIYYVNQTLKIDKSLKDTFNIADCYLILENIYYHKGNLDSALHYLLKAKELSEKYNFGFLEAIYSNLGDIYFLQNQLDSAIKYYKNAIEFEKKTNLSLPQLINYLNLAKIYSKQKQYEKADSYIDSAYHIYYNVLKDKNVTNKIAIYQKFYEVYELKNSPDSALKYYKAYITYRDSAEYSKNLAKVKILAFESNLENIKRQLAQVEKSNKEKNKLLTRLVVILAIFLISFILIVSMYIKLRKAEKQLSTKNTELKKLHSSLQEEFKKQADLNQKIFAQSLLVEEQKRILEETSNQLKTTLKNLNSSIDYASYMVESILQSDKYLANIFFDYFLIFKPLGKIGGDFYFATKIDDIIYIAVGDATGHGIPGAILAMQGVIMLQEIVIEQKVKSPAQVLEKLRFKIKNLFKKTDKEGISYNSIDMGFASINTQTNELVFTGANLPLYIVRNREVIKLKAVKSPLGLYLVERPYQEINFTLQDDDMIYLQSDGYVDQIGEVSHGHFSKFGAKRYTTLLAEISTKSCQEQKKILIDKLNSWKKSENQIDDITILGIRWKSQKE